MPTLPPFPDVTPDGVGSAPVVMRYEDVAQDGRLMIESLATSVNEALWRVALRGHPLEAEAFEKGTLAILSRIVAEGGDGPFSVDGPFEAEAKFVLARSEDAAGEVERLYLNAWVDTFAPIGRTNFPAGPRAGERALVGRVFSEHVFTRPFAPPEARKVKRFAIPGLPEVPAVVHAPAPLGAILAAPAGASELGAYALDETKVVFGLRHTDSNQHVNSLVYPQLFEDAVLRRLDALGLDVRVQSRTLEIGYRKPCFAGQVARVALAVYRLGDELGAYGGFYDAADLARAGLGGTPPNAYVHMTFAPAAR